MPRLLLKHKEVVRQLANVTVTHDGSLRLSLVRDGISESGFNWSGGPNGPGSMEACEKAEPKTKSITIHTSGRVNYHFNGGATIYAPCLLDLEDAIPIIAYSIPSAEQLDQVTGRRSDDFVLDIPVDLERVTFLFEMVPAILEERQNEICRFGVEGLYALSWRFEVGAVGVTPDGVPEQAFTTARPTHGLPNQAIPEEEAYLRFRGAMYANDVITAAKDAPNRDEITAQHIEAMIQAGPGLYPPNQEGIWTCLTRVPMRVAPNLKVNFDDPRYRAEVVDLRPGDTRLATVRVRFRVFDDVLGIYVKKPVAISGYELDAELY